MNKNHVYAALLVGALLASATPASAGYRHVAPVIIYGSSAEGSFGSARNSADNQQFIVCVTQARGDTLAVACHATPVGGGTKSCFSHNPLFVAAAQSGGSAEPHRPLLREPWLGR